MYMLKYASASFLHAAHNNKFTSWVNLFGGDRILEFNSKEDYNLEELILSRIDDHFINIIDQGKTEKPMFPEVLKQLAKRKRQCIILCISDFMDGVQFTAERMVWRKTRQDVPPKSSIQDVLLPLGELACQHRIVVLFINDFGELTYRETDYETFSQETAFQDVESCSKNSKITITKDGANKMVDNVKNSHNNLAERFRKFGIMYETLVAGRDDEKLDKKIYELGAVTGG